MTGPTVDPGSGTKSRRRRGPRKSVIPDEQPRRRPGVAKPAGCGEGLRQLRDLDLGGLLRSRANQGRPPPEMTMLHGRQGKRESGGSHVPIRVIRLQRPGNSGERPHPGVVRPCPQTGKRASSSDRSGGRTF